MAATGSGSLTAGSLVVLALAGCAALALAAGEAAGSAGGGAEALSTPALLLGVALLVWAVLVCGACAVHLVHLLLSRRAPGRAQVLLLLAGAAATAAVLRAHPLWGSGSGRG